MARLAMGQMVVNDDEKVVQLKHNPSYDNLYRPGNAIWRLRMLRMGMVPSINDNNADLNTTMDMGSVESAPVVSEPLRINNTKDMMSMPSDQQLDMEQLIKDEAAAKPAAKTSDESFEARRQEPTQYLRGADQSKGPTCNWLPRANHHQGLRPWHAHRESDSIPVAFGASDRMSIRPIYKG
jgi:hypothetical protein